MTNFPLFTDSYKLTHHKMYPPGTEYIGSYFESRSGGEFGHAVFFGLQYLLDNYLEGWCVDKNDVKEAAAFSAKHFGQDVFNADGWNYIADELNGELPISIRAVPEGTLVPEGNVLLTIENTDPKCAWLVNHIETLLVQLWYPTTVATISFMQKMVLLKALEETGDPAAIDFKLHDFGYRGSTSVESAAIGGSAHLVNFQGSDTIAGMELLQDHYDADMPAFSVPAAEHSTITAWGEEGEVDAYAHILKTFPKGLVSVVSDSWNIYDACEKLWGEELHDEVVSFDRTLVVRPDSGDPHEVVPRCLDILGDKFGFTNNEKGFKVLPPYIRLIQGDGISRHTIPTIVEAIKRAGWSLDNVVFGSGGGLLQDCNRDTMRFAFKASWATVNGETRDVYKRPASDPTKNSKRGKLKLVESRAGDTLNTVALDDPGQDLLQEVFRNGRIMRRTHIGEVRERANEGLRWLRS